MATLSPAQDTRHGPWNPGVESAIPEELRHLTTLLRPENVFTALAEARELRGFTGLDYPDVVAFRPSRLALHEVLIRVSADLSVPDGQRIEDLGINFREITRRIMARLEPRMGEIDALYAKHRKEISALTLEELAAVAPENASRASAEWAKRARDETKPLKRAAPHALARAVSAVLVRHGRLWGPREVVAGVAATMACNDVGSSEIGRLIEPWFAAIALEEGYRALPAQERPIVMNTKGASASGKTTIRPLQRRLAATIGADWGEFALISPDIWRKQLLDYGSLGAAYKYAGPFTGEELRIVDQKLDLYMAEKAERGQMPHLLIDRFRFDSFAPHSDEAGSNLLTRFGREVYLFFMITPPAALVERAWKRGLEVGRYKAVDDTLAHSVEAYSGMPQLFFTWVERADKQVRFEFLDNAVPEGERPLTSAFGWNHVLNVLDAKALLDVERFRRIDVDARSPDELFPDTSLPAERNASFLRDCLRRFPRVDFADRETGRVYLRVEAGKLAWADRDGLSRAAFQPEPRAALAAILPEAFASPPPPPTSPVFLGEADRKATVGRWGATDRS